MRKIELANGQEYRVILRGLGSAGYTWEYNIEDSDKIAVSITPVGSKPKKLPARGPPPPNYNIDQMAIITGLKTGQAKLHLTQRQPWEHEKPPRREILIEIMVTE